jgi:Nicotinate phosphoribosyltransferase (NAPRTase) N-terminal domain
VRDQEPRVPVFSALVALATAICKPALFSPRSEALIKLGTSVCATTTSSATLVRDRCGGRQGRMAALLPHPRCSIISPEAPSCPKPFAILPCSRTGLEQARDFLEDVRLRPEDISFLRRHSVFAHVNDAFFYYLKTFRFTGEVWAVPEGTPIFSEEPHLFRFVNVSLEMLLARCGHAFRSSQIAKAALLCGLLASG